MRFFIETKEEKRIRHESEKKRRGKWKKWFAWYPVEIYDVKKMRRVRAWLEFVLRRQDWFQSTADTTPYGWWLSDYRDIKDGEEEFMATQAELKRNEEGYIVETGNLTLGELIDCDDIKTNKDTRIKIASKNETWVVLSVYKDDDEENTIWIDIEKAEK